MVQTDYKLLASVQLFYEALRGSTSLDFTRTDMLSDE
jgi:hypothetical protein